MRILWIELRVRKMMHLFVSKTDEPSANVLDPVVNSEILIEDPVNAPSLVDENVGF